MPGRSAPVAGRRVQRAFRARHCAGIAAGHLYGDRKYHGVAPAAKLLDVKVLGDDGSGELTGILMGLEWALRKKAEAAVTEIFDVVISLGGTLSAEHGIGASKAKYLGIELGTKEMRAMSLIKRSFDSHNILNPGKFTDLLSNHE